VDTQQNLAKVDIHRNVLVVIIHAVSIGEAGQFVFPRNKENAVAFPSQLFSDDQVEYIIPISTDTLYVFYADGTRHAFPLATGESERVYSKMYQVAPSDQLPVLLDCYGESHSKLDISRLQQVISKTVP
jgi:hypothetical protein